MNNMINNYRSMEEVEVSECECPCPYEGTENNEACEVGCSTAYKESTMEALFLEVGAIITSAAPVAFVFAYTDATISAAVAVAHLAGVGIGIARYGKRSKTPILHIDDPPRPKGGATRALLARHAT